MSITTSTPTDAPRTLDERIERAGGPVQMLRDAPVGAYPFPIRAEFTNWRDEQRSWAETAALLHQSHHMPELFLDGPDALRLACALYDELVAKTVPVTSIETAEAVKLTENIFRSVNIALVNELKIVFEAMGIDVWEVIEAAKTKPFGYMPFYPGPGLGGHCIPIDPFYLTWKAREYDIATRFIELAGEINTAMPRRVVDKTIAALSERAGRALNGAQVLIVGVAYKKNVDDPRESPALKIMEFFEQRGAKASFHDPHLAKIPQTREHPTLNGRSSLPLTEATLAAIDVAVICTDHDAIDYALLVEKCPLIIDTRNVCARRGLSSERVVKA